MPKLVQPQHYVPVGLHEYALDLVDAEGAPRCVIRSVLQVDYVNVFVAVALLRCQREEAFAV